MKRSGRWALAALLLGPAPVAAQGRLDLDALRRLVDIQSPELSPDGKSVAVILSRPDYDANHRAGELALVDVASGSTRVLTRGRWAVDAPRWSPTGDRIAFVDQVGEGDDQVPQVCILPMAGGDARCVTHAKRGVAQYAWSPDGKSIAYATEDVPEEKTGEEKHNRSFEVGDDSFLTREAARSIHLWIVSAEGGEARRLTSGEWSLTKSDGTSPIAFAPDGKTITFAAQETAHTGDFRTSVIRTVDVATGSLRTVTSGFGMGPSFSPRGDLIAFSRSRGPAPWFSSHSIFLVSPMGGAERNATFAIDRTFYGASWTPDGRNLVLSADDGTRTSIWIQPLDGQPERLDLGDLQPSELSVGSNGALAFVATTPTRPEELYYLSAPGRPPRRLTDENATVAALSLGRAESVEWDVGNGFRADGVVFYPPGFDPSQKYPLVLEIHGGPMGASTTGFSPLPQLLAAQGWLVFAPNYRGSDNRGNAYQSAIIGDAGDGPGKDVMAGLAMLEKRGFVDERRIGVSGWSYGGYMTTWLIGHYDVWKAAVAGAAVTDYADQYNLSDINVTFGGGWGGSPWLPSWQEMVRKQSPITYADHIKTPTLILCDVGDYRVPIVESFKLYHALRDRGVPVRFFAYPVMGHFPGDPVHARDVLRRWTSWFHEQFGDRP